MSNLISHQEVIDRLGISRPTLYHMRRRGDFIPEVMVSARRIAFRMSDFNNWLEGRTLH